MGKRKRRLLFTLIVLVGVGGATGLGVALGKVRSAPVTGPTGPASSDVIHTLSSGLVDLRWDTYYGRPPDIFYSITNLSSGSRTYSYAFTNQLGQIPKSLSATFAGTFTLAGGQSQTGRLIGLAFPTTAQLLRLVVTERTASGVAASAKPFVEVTYYQASADYVANEFTNDDPKDTPSCCLISSIMPLSDFTDVVTAAPPFTSQHT
jgi:hypothetical protein